jgi:hypothetical protein
MVSSLRADPTADPDDTDPDATDPDAADADAGSTVADGGGESARGD